MFRFLAALATVCFCGLSMIACDVTSTNPPSGTAAHGASVPLLGSWQVEKLGPVSADRPITVEISEAENGDLLGVMQTANPREARALLTNIGGTLIASVASDSGDWTLYALAVDTAGTTLEIKELDTAILRRDIEGGLLAGEVLGIDGNDYAVHLKASPEALRAYLEGNSDVFSEVVAELKKVVP